MAQHHCVEQQKSQVVRPPGISPADGGMPLTGIVIIKDDTRQRVRHRPSNGDLHDLLESSPLAGEGQDRSAPILCGGLNKTPSPSTGEGQGGGEHSTHAVLPPPGGKLNTLWAPGACRTVLGEGRGGDMMRYDLLCAPFGRARRLVKVNLLGERARRERHYAGYIGERST
jgi:hypothetical protein